MKENWPDSSCRLPLALCLTESKPITWTMSAFFAGAVAAEEDLGGICVCAATEKAAGTTLRKAAGSVHRARPGA